jgi:putative nucleotidyltransferase with HDIG domain
MLATADAVPAAHRERRVRNLIVVPGPDDRDDVPRAVAQRLLATALPRRWSHVQAVGTKAERIAGLLDPPDAPVLVAAAWLHDIGYAPELVDTGFHPLDGARWLRRRGIDPRVVVLVANHSYAVIEAAERGLAGVLTAEFPAERSVTADALVYCDLTTGPDGQTLDVVDRLADIRDRYGPDSPVGRFVDRARPEIVTTVRRIEAQIGRGGRPVADGT